MTQTEKYKLNKPDPSDFYDVADFNANADIIEKGLVDTNAKIDDNKIATDTALAGKASSFHYHNATHINAGTLSNDRLGTVPLEKGGTGATSAANARTNLGAISIADFNANADIIDKALADTNTKVDENKNTTDTALNGKADAKHSHDASDITTGKLDIDRLWVIPLEKGGTGANTADEARTNLNAISLEDITNYLKHADSLELSIKPYLNEGTQTPYTSGLLRISSNNSPLLMGGRMTVIESQGNSTVKSAGEAKLESNTRATVYSPIEAKLEGNVRVVVSSSGTISLSGRTTTIESQGNATIKGGADARLEGKTGAVVKSPGEARLEGDTKASVYSPKEARLEGDTKASVYSPKEAKLEGNVRVVVSSSGTISLSGRTTTIESQGNATIKGGADARLEGKTGAVVKSPREARLEGDTRAVVHSPAEAKMYGGTSSTLQSREYLCQATNDSIKIGNMASTNAYYVNSGGCGQYSDESFKENIDYDLSDSLSKFNQLKPALFNMIGGDSRTAGFIAQDVQEVYPDLVDTIDKEGHLGVRYSAIHSLAVAKIQQLEQDFNSKVTSLEEKIQSLEAKLNATT